MAVEPALNLPIERPVLITRASHPEYATEVLRLQSFINFPTSCPVRPVNLVSAGFFYTGRGDVVRCFYCDMGLFEWIPGEEPWEEHARWYAQCNNLINCKGEAFIQQIQEKYGSASESGISPLLGVASQVLSSDVEDEEQHHDHVQEQGSVAEVLARGRDGYSIIEEENRQLKEERLCKVCLDSELQIAFLPCGHMCCCSVCALSLNKCPVYRSRASGTVRIFMS